MPDAPVGAASSSALSKRHGTSGRRSRGRDGGWTDRPRREGEAPETRERESPRATASVECTVPHMRCAREVRSETFFSFRFRGKWRENETLPVGLPDAGRDGIGNQSVRLGTEH